MFTGKATQLTVYFGESDQYHSQALYAAMLEMLRREGCGARDAAGQPRPAASRGSAPPA